MTEVAPGSSPLSAPMSEPPRSRGDHASSPVRQRQIGTAGTSKTNINSHAIRRIRQACANCRSRKIRCSGERPSCFNCSRVSQSCLYVPYSAQPRTLAGARVESKSPPGRHGTASHNTDLLHRLATIERRLSKFDNPSSVLESRPPDDDDGGLADATPSPVPSLHEQEVVTPAPDVDLNRSTASSPVEFPSKATVEQLVDAYFTFSHNQPYSYFHEASFRQRLASDSLPKCLLFAVMASASRFIKSDQYLNNNREASEGYARKAWLHILSDHLAKDDTTSVCVAQAANILAINEFTAGRTSSAWIKIGLAVRITQDLHLMKEPDTSLPLVEQEELRRTFWSVYLLDKLVSCGRDRTPASLDVSCQVRLPCEEAAFRSGASGDAPSLEQMADWDQDIDNQQGYFPLAILAGSVLGRCTKELWQESTKHALPPWNPNSEYASTLDALLLLESRLKLGERRLGEIIASYKTEDGAVDHQTVGHAIFARVVFHLCYCLLNHHFLLRLRLRRLNQNNTSGFLFLALQRAYTHARDLVRVLQEARDAGGNIGASFYAYTAFVAGGVLLMNLQTERGRPGSRHRETAAAFQGSLDVLSSMGGAWDHTSKLYQRLLLLSEQSQSYPIFHMNDPLTLDHASEDLLWGLVDYGKMCRESLPSPATMRSQLTPPSLQQLDDAPFSFFEPLPPDEDNVDDAPRDVSMTNPIGNGYLTMFDTITPGTHYLLDLASRGG